MTRTPRAKLHDTPRTPSRPPSKFKVAAKVTTRPTKRQPELPIPVGVAAAHAGSNDRIAEQENYAARATLQAVTNGFAAVFGEPPPAIPSPPKQKKQKLTFWSLLVMLDPQVKLAFLVSGFFLIHLIFFGLESYQVQNKPNSAAPLNLTNPEVNLTDASNTLDAPTSSHLSPVLTAYPPHQLPLPAGPPGPQGMNQMPGFTGPSTVNAFEPHSQNEQRPGPFQPPPGASSRSVSSPPMPIVIPGRQLPGELPRRPLPAGAREFDPSARPPPQEQELVSAQRPESVPQSEPEPAARTEEPKETEPPCPECIEAPLVPSTFYVPDQFNWRQTDKAAVHCFTLGPKSDKHCVFQPLCYDKTDSSLLLAEGERACSGYNRSVSSLRNNCPQMTQDAIRDSNFESVRALDAESDDAVWVEGTTILQRLDRSCGNIAHFAGRIFYLNHVISNYASYYLKKVDNIIVLPGDDVMKRFTRPARYGFWHKHILEAIVYPFVPSFSSKPILSPISQTRRVAVLQSLDIGDPSKRYVCFREALVVGYMKGRFFASDREVPSVEESWVSASSKDAPDLPRESMKFRSNIFGLLNGQSKVPKITKRIVFLDRAGTRRAIVPESKEKLLALLAKLADAHGFQFESVSFDSMTAREQVASVSKVGIAVAVHGAQMVNSIFMPPLSVLFELFPFSFSHDMYVEGGRAGLKYYSYALQRGDLFPDSQKLGFSSPADCIHASRECKIFYRDSALEFQPEDLQAVRGTLEDAFRYLEGLK